MLHFPALPLTVGMQREDTQTDQRERVGSCSFKRTTVVSYCASFAVARYIKILRLSAARRADACRVRAAFVVHSRKMVFLFAPNAILDIVGSVKLQTFPTSYRP
ncbi:hypothetical protein EVAR_95951_1 [Eumeta japonica]|uniref:Uncharacterized protein n=1 Tax=Eumeta variegata TaxID=151549 RepID=A0A4C1V980_EUMVA|nr:hypothetical protein EVAR_95951_1 [Eumeta japonica]